MKIFDPVLITAHSSAADELDGRARRNLRIVHHPPHHVVETAAFEEDESPFAGALADLSMSMLNFDEVCASFFDVR